MYMHPQQAIYFTDAGEKEQLTRELRAGRFPAVLQFLEGKRGLFFTNDALQQFLREEVRHDLFYVSPVNGISLATSSDGEQKKALLHHLLSKAPDFLVVDDVFGNLDTKTQWEIIEQLRIITGRATIVQLFGRRNDLLPFMDQVWVLKTGLLSSVHKTELPDLSIVKSKTNAAIPSAPDTLHYLENPLVAFTNVTVHYENRCILRNISWQINKSEYWQLQGPNGSGKTTLLSMINGDNTKAYGQDIRLFGYQKGTGESIWDIKQHIGYFSQHILRFFERADSAEYMIAGGLLDSIGLYQLPTDLMTQQAHAWLKVLDLYEQRSKPFNHFASAQQRLILIARAMIKHPPLLILDEPTAGLNDKDAALIVQLINQVAAETDSAIIFVSHRPETNLQAPFVFELIAGEGGSVGKRGQGP
jgi:molybdate transport system ATP-binding protein